MRPNETERLRDGQHRMSDALERAFLRSVSNFHEGKKRL
jgi:hypothetical protein